MKILFNCSTNVLGGAIQNAYNFIIHAQKDQEIDWFFLVSPQVFDQIEKVLDTDAEKIVKLNSPARSLKNRKLVLQYEKQFDPDLVYTMAGPAYVDFKNPHVVGISNAYLTSARLRTIIYGRSILESLMMVLTTLYQALYIKKADFFFFQTLSSRDAFCKRYAVKRENTAIVPNAISNIFKARTSQNEKADDRDRILIFSPAAAFPHKGLHKLPNIAFRLKQVIGDQKIQFIITLPFNTRLWKRIQQKAKKLHVLDCIKNIGPFDHEKAAELHQDADIIFIPSVLETFSTSYLEGLASQKPLLVVDLPFAREICGDHAQYMPPYSIKGAVSNLSNIIADYDLHLQRAEEYNTDLLRFGNQSERYSAIKKNLITIANT
jgi:glycosyltransferase involved in cell wall biosynthesis